MCGTYQKHSIKTLGAFSKLFLPLTFRDVTIHDSRKFMIFGLKMDQEVTAGRIWYHFCGFHKQSCEFMILAFHDQQWNQISQIHLCLNHLQRFWPWSKQKFYFINWQIDNGQNCFDHADDSCISSTQIKKSFDCGTFISKKLYSVGCAKLCSSSVIMLMYFLV